MNNVTKLADAISTRVESNLGNHFKTIAIGTATFGEKHSIRRDQLPPVPQISGEVIPRRNGTFPKKILNETKKQIYKPNKRTGDVFASIDRNVGIARGSNEQPNDPLRTGNTVFFFFL